MTSRVGSAHIVLTAMCALLFGACAAAPAGSPAIRADADDASPDFGSVEVTGLDRDAVRALERAGLAQEEWEAILAVYTTGDAAVTDAQPVLGSYAVTPSGLRFSPRFPPVAGRPYRVRFDLSAIPGGARGEPDPPLQTVAVLDTTVSFGVRPASGLVRVASVYPSTDVVPVNLLRLYITFTAPMSVGEAYSRIHLLDAAGDEVADAFLVVPQELWDPSHTRLTLLFDPGRIKRGLRPNEEAGLPLRSGRDYTLVIDSLWKDGAGVPMAASFRRTFSVTEADRRMPRVEDWRLIAPAAGTLDPVELHFPEPLDYALVQRLIRLRREDGAEIEGTIEIVDRETRWTFLPASPWNAGRYTLTIGTELEDIAGNSLRRTFDTDPADPGTGEEAAMVELAFVVSRDSPS